MTYLPDPSTFQQPFTPDRQERFLEQLSLSGNVRLACRAVSIAPNTAYRWRQSSAEFADGWDRALVSARAAVEQVLADRALNGIEEPVFYHGEEIARRRRYSDRLLLAHLARLDALAERIEHQDEVHHAEVMREGEPDAHALPVPPPPACPDCGGYCDDPRAIAMGLLGPDDCQWLENRITRMEDARPLGAKCPQELAAETGLSADDIEAFQLDAFEEEGHEWWLVTNAEEYRASWSYEDEQSEGEEADRGELEGGESDDDRGA